jgi:hypothetical protein
LLLGLWDAWGSCTALDVLVRIGVAEGAQASMGDFHLEDGRHITLLDQVVEYVELDIRVGEILTTGVVSLHLLGCGQSRLGEVA